MRNKLVILSILLAAVLILAGCGGSEAPVVEDVDCPDCPDCPEIECPVPLVDEVPFEEAWAGSGHAKSDAEAFRHWDEEDDGLLPGRCAKCHSTEGYLDFHGADGSEVGTIDNEIVAVEVMGVECVACHNKEDMSDPKLNSFKLAAHGLCKECHKKNKDTAPTKCSGCHIK